MRASWALATTGAVAAVLLPFGAALGAPGYSHRTQYISELGARDAPDAGLVSFGFVVVGALLVATGAVLARSLVEPRSAVWAVAVVALALGGSYLVSGIAPCDPGCPDGRGESAGGSGFDELSSDQRTHDIAGVLGYTVAVGGVVAFAWAARGSDGGPASLAVAAAAIALALATTQIDSWRGVFQRLLELVLLVWLVDAVRRLTVPEERAPLTTSL